jgi:hypothetical protein
VGAVAAVGVDGRLPGAGGRGQDGGLDVGVDRQPGRKQQLATDQVVDEGVGGAGGVGADQDRPGSDRLG